MGLYGVFLAIGQITGSLIGGVAASWLGIDGLLFATRRAARDRAHPAGVPAAPGARGVEPGLRHEPSAWSRRRDDSPAAGARARARPGVARPRSAGRGRRAAPSRDRGGPRHPPGGRLRGRRGDRDERRARGRHAVELRDRRRRVLAGLGGGRAAAPRAERLRAGARVGRSGGDPGSRAGDAAAPRAARDHGPGRGAVVGRRARAVRAPVAGEVLAPAIELARDGFPAWAGFISSVETTLAAIEPVVGSGSGFERVFRPHGRRWRPGEIVRMPALAATLERLAVGRVRRLLRGRRRGAPGAGARGGRLRDHDGRSARPHLDLDGADRDRLPRRPGDDPPAELVGDRRVGAAQRPGAVRGAAAGGVRPERRHRPALGPPRRRGREARRWPTATRT